MGKGNEVEAGGIIVRRGVMWWEGKRQEISDGTEWNVDKCGERWRRYRWRNGKREGNGGGWNLSVAWRGVMRWKGKDSW